MSSLIDDVPEGSNAPEGQNTPEFSVSELSGAVKRMVEGEFGHVRVRGEIGRVSRPRSGHIYMDLKDDRAVLAGVIWKGVAAGLAVQPEEGMEVVATGRLTTFAGQSRYQIVIESLAPAGVGALMAMLEKRRKALAAEGLFDEGRKRALPYLPRSIGVVTSPTGDATVAIPIPNAPTLISSLIHHAWLIVDLAAPNNPLGVVSTGGITARVGA